MSVKAVKTKRKDGSATAKRKRTIAQQEADFEALLTKIENDPDAPLIAKELVPLMRERRERAKQGEPYLTIEQIQEELGRE
jgi:hypothetical protein